MRYALSNFLSNNFPLLNEEFFDLPSWYLVSLGLALCAAVLAARLLSMPLGLLVAFLSRQHAVGDKRLFIEKLSGPIQVFATLVLFLAFTFFIREPQEADIFSKSMAIRLAVFL